MTKIEDNCFYVIANISKNSGWGNVIWGIHKNHIYHGKRVLKAYDCLSDKEKEDYKIYELKWLEEVK